MAAILDLEVAMTSEVTNDNSNGFVTLKSVENNTSFATVSHMVPEILHLVFFSDGEWQPSWI